MANPRAGTFDARRVAIIGGGSSGVIALKELLEQGVRNVTVFETQAGGGGLYRRDNYDNACHTSNMCYTSFACFPPEDVRQCGHFSLRGYVEYLEKFADEFRLRDFVKFSTTVTKVAKTKDEWSVTYSTNGDVTTDVFDVVICASGTHTNHANPRSFAWLEGFSGDVIHSSEFRSAEKTYTGKRVVVCGAGESGSDISLWASKVASKTWITMKERTGHVTPRGAHAPEEDHIDHQHMEAHRKDPEHIPPEVALDSDLSPLHYGTGRALFGTHAYRDVLVMCTWQFYPGAKLNIYHRSTINSQFGTKNSGFSAAIAQYGCEPKPPITKCDGSTVVFEDGSTAENVDAIVLCIGYKNDILFLEDDLKEKVLNPRNLLKHAVHPDVPNFYLCGFIRPAFGNIPSIAEMQARWIAQLVTKKKKLPPKDEMCAIVEKDRAWEESTYAYAGKKLKPLTSYYHQMMDLATLTESHPDYGALLFEDPALFAKIVMGQFTGFQFRLRDCSPELKARYRKLIMKMPIANIWSFDLAIIVTAFHGYLVLGGFDAFKLKGTTPFQNMAPLSRRLLAVVLLGNPFYLLLVALPCFLVCVAAFLFVQLNSVRIASNLDFFRGGLNRPAHYLLKGPFDTLHVYWARVQLATFMLVTMPYDLALTLLFKKHLQGQSHLPTSKFMEMENNYKKQIGEFAFTH
mmetsp:Transcript_20527/g.63445  ORF Transcript_20527/g.63445 Transcript_20527/m.63445 type:complete len:685 (-) Transcript_20527:122-2176(-)